MCVCTPMLIGGEKNTDIQNLKDSPWWPFRRRQCPSNPVLDHHTVGTSPTTCTSSGSSSREHILPIPSHSLSGDTYSLFSSNSKPKWDSSYPQNPPHAVNSLCILEHNSLCILKHSLYIPGNYLPRVCLAPLSREKALEVSDYIMDFPPSIYYQSSTLRDLQNIIWLQLPEINFSTGTVNKLKSMQTPQ